MWLLFDSMCSGRDFDYAEDRLAFGLITGEVGLLIYIACVLHVCKVIGEVYDVRNCCGGICLPLDGATAY